MLDRWSRAGLIGPSIAALFALAILVALGSWQMQRKHWKEGLIAQRAVSATRSPTNWQAAYFEQGQLAEFTRVQLVGRFHHDKERYWFADGPEGSGFHVFTPFEVDGGGIVWIDRGYIPARLRDPGTRAAGQVADRTSVVGAVRFPGERNRFTPENNPIKNIWYWKDLPALHASAFPPPSVPRRAPTLVELDGSAPVPGGWPKAIGTKTMLSNRHLEYALTWFGLAGALIGVFFTFARGRLTRALE